MNSKDTEMMIKALREARHNIFTGRYRFVCVALPSYDVASVLVKDWIEEQLDGSGTFEDWLMLYHEDTYRDMSNGDFRNARVQWIDAMIYELKNSQRGLK